jgi:hypothetical protein
MPLVLRIEEFIDDKYDGEVFVDFYKGEIYVHLLNNDIVSFSKISHAVDFLTLYLDVQNSTFNTYFYIHNTSEKDEFDTLSQLTEYSSLFGYDDAVLSRENVAHWLRVIMNSNV